MLYPHDHVYQPLYEHIYEPLYEHLHEPLYEHLYEHLAERAGAWAVSVYRHAQSAAAPQGVRKGGCL